MRQAGSVRRQSERGRRFIATYAVALLLSAQLLALAHYHQSDSSRRFTPQTQVSADADRCGLCLLVLHTPLNPVASPVIDRPRFDTLPERIARAVQVGSDANPFVLTRAPPAVAI